MATKIMLAKQFGALRPIDTAGEEVISNMGNGEIVSVEIKRPRNVGHHRKLFALLGLVADNHPTYTNVDLVLAAVKIELGHVDILERPNGERVPLPRSISFAKMDQSAFDAFYDGVVKLIVTRFLPGVNRADLEREVNEIILGRRAA